jgi:putative transposase
MYTSGTGKYKTCQRLNGPWVAHYVTFSCFQRRAFLARDRTRDYLTRAIDQARGKHGFHLWAYAIMPEHVHLLIWPARESYSISAILKSIKQSVSRKAVNWLRKNNPQGLRWLSTGQVTKPYQFWQDGGGYDREVRTGQGLRQVLDYIHLNPVRRGLAGQSEQWFWSSARQWSDLGVGPVRIDRESCLNSMA